MTRSVFLFLAGWIFLFLQTGPLALCLPEGFKPDLLLLLVVFLGLREPPLRGATLAFFLGCLMDVFAGRTLGLNGLVMVVLFLALRATADRVNTESPLLILLMAAIGTLFAGLVQAFLLGYFAGQVSGFTMVLRRLPPQVVLNFAAALVLLGVGRVLERRLVPKLIRLGLWPRKRLV